MTLLQTGFRPFFLLAATLAVVQMPLWVLGLLQVLPATGGVSWHAHEMLFGFTVSVIAGFLLTAARNWTGRETANGKALAALCGVWIAGRIAVSLAPALPAWLVAGIDLAFLPALGFFVAKPIILAKQWRQLAIIGIITALTLCNAVFHASGAMQRVAWLVALDLILTLIVIIGGRVIPMFTKNATGAAVRSYPIVERLSIASAVLLLIAEISQRASLIGVACLLAGLTQAVRLQGWSNARVWRIPILWVLHVGYAWLGVGFLLRGVAQFMPRVAEPAAIHLLTTGAIGTLVLGMMARVALGHTGRPLSAPSSAIAGFFLVSLAAATRALVPLFAPGLASLAYAVAGSAWVIAFALYLIRYTPWLIAPRPDGRPG